MISIEKLHIVEKPPNTSLVVSEEQHLASGLLRFLSTKHMSTDFTAEEIKRRMTCVKMGKRIVACVLVHGDHVVCGSSEETFSAFKLPSSLTVDFSVCDTIMKDNLLIIGGSFGNKHVGLEAFLMVELSRGRLLSAVTFQSVRDFVVAASEKNVALGKLVAFDGRYTPLRNAFFQATLVSLWSYQGDEGKFYLSVQVFTYTKEETRPIRKLMRIDFAGPVAKGGGVRCILTRPDSKHTLVALAINSSRPRCSKVVFVSVNTSHCKF